MPEAESSPAPLVPAPLVPAPHVPAPLVLAGDFDASSHDDWVALADEVGGVDKLSSTTPDGIRVRPLYTSEDAPAAASRAWRAAPNAWDVRQRHAEPDPRAAREAIAADLENGVTSIWLVVGDGATAVADIPTVLAEVYLDLAPVVLDAGSAGPEAALAFLSAATDRVPNSELLGTLGLDPIGVRARTGDGPPVNAVVPLAREVAGEYPKLRAIVVDALPVHVAGGSDAQELGFSLAAGVAYLRVLTGAGLEPGTAARLLEFRLAATAEQFPTIAKLRAARRLWSRVAAVCGAPTVAVLHAVGSPTMLTRRDPYLNLLRGTLAGFGAGIGGADAVTVPPFDAALGAAEPFSRRIARNTHALLVEESHVARVADPAGGSWYVESLTDAVARAAWAFFQEIEAAGGAVAALDAGLVAERVAAVAARRARGAATRRVPLTGVSEFPDAAEKPLHRRRLARPAGGGLPVHRPAEPYEALRDRSDAHLATVGTRPRAFLATLGPLAAYAVRAGFTRNLLQAGGVEAVDGGPTETPADVVAAFVAAGTPVVVLCSTDALYAERASATVAALRDAGAAHVLLAGPPVDGPAPGLDGHLSAGCDALAVLDAVYAALEVAT
ncbi:MAG: methylmalonyl-CoA mutase subunit beta [Pseudonocardia sp.]|nr:methylmalonyl-CoA mutase subunit beta [Pseudonocardia sp.]